MLRSYSTIGFHSSQANLFISNYYAVASNRYDNPSGGTIEVISPASSPVQPQQDKPEERQPQPPGEDRRMRQISNRVVNLIRKRIQLLSRIKT